MCVCMRVWRNCRIPHTHTRMRRCVRQNCAARVWAMNYSYVCAARVHRYAKFSSLLLLFTHVRTRTFRSLRSVQQLTWGGGGAHMGCAIKCCAARHTGQKFKRAIARQLITNICAHTPIWFIRVFAVVWAYCERARKRRAVGWCSTSQSAF